MPFAKQGGQGAKFRVQAEKIFKCLGLPKGAKEELGISGDDGMRIPDPSPTKTNKDMDEEKLAAEAKKQEEQKWNYELFGEGRYFICPSFFRMMMFLKK